MALREDFHRIIVVGIDNRMLKIYGTNSCGNIISFTKVKLGSNAAMGGFSSPQRRRGKLAKAEPGRPTPSSPRGLISPTPSGLIRRDRR